MGSGNNKNIYLPMIEEFLSLAVPETGGIGSVLSDAVRYSLLAGGKRIRPTLVLAFCDFFGGDVKKALPFACAVEMIHTYSLIHDDLPCMDNDDLRRGKPSNHIVFGEDMALLAGDALQALAFETMARAIPETGMSGAYAAYYLAEASGLTGMVGGQVIDLKTEGGDPDVDTILEMYSGKTGALIRASCYMGTALAGQEVTEGVQTYASDLGLVFQIVDDLLDIESDTATLGKPVGSDAENKKVNYVTKIGSDEARKLVEKLTAEAVEAIDGISGNTDFLKSFALELSHRIN